MADLLRGPQVRPGQREMAFCHECRDEWYTNEHGLICPECHSEFTEIMEDNNDPPGAAAHGPPPFPHYHDHDHDHDHHDHDHDPYARYESMRAERGGRNTLDYTSGLLPDGRFVRTRLFFGPGDRHPSTSPYPRHQEQPPPPIPERNGPSETPPELMQILQNIVGGGFGGEGFRQRRSSSSRSGDGAADRSRNDDMGNIGPPHLGRHRPRAEAYEITMAFGGGEPPRLGNGRFVHSPNARLSPRDANQAQPTIEPVDALSTLIGGLLQQMHPPGIPGHRSPGPDELSGAFTAMVASFLTPGVAGDAVYTQEALDRVMSQLMEQHTGGNAPGPAPEEAIAALPKKKADRSMLDGKDEGDCSVCMDSVSVGSEVTNLPCGHWFHEHCVSMWLREHNTCPICRKGITPNGEEARQQPRPSGATSGTASGASTSPSDRSAPRNESEGSGGGSLGGRVRQWFSSGS
ncbi:hypothetical protein FGG08_006425 [Glutinoglossum americanum]|uniref:RING-type E3 ubiquitin transferase n=1 Tax=Glutinoglossum americanum TaxID=1670608 RepID=A0A9P8HSM7_9PEZI|nr:hypothetical protein FGG08_006425 [Glutinoglossum americanum]